MALVPAGVYAMQKRRPRSTEVAAFCLDLTEVTVAAYKACVRERKCSPECLALGQCSAVPTQAEWGEAQESQRASRFCNGDRDDRQDHPVNCVSWDESVKFCEAHGKRLPRPEFPNVPILADQLSGKMANTIARQSFALWQAVSLTDKFFTLPPGTPAPLVAAYRNAYQKVIHDPEFNERGQKLSEVFEPMSTQDVNSLVKDIVATPNEAVKYVESLLRKQGIVDSH